jgi:hypothetical protein
VFKMVNVANRRELYQQLCRRRWGWRGPMDGGW